MAMMISWVMPVNPSHPCLENDPAPSFAPTICAFHLGFSLGQSLNCKTGNLSMSITKKTTLNVAGALRHCYTLENSYPPIMVV